MIAIDYQPGYTRTYAPNAQRKEFFRNSNSIHCQCNKGYIIATQLKKDAECLMSFTADHWSSDFNSDVLLGLR